MARTLSFDEMEQVGNNSRKAEFFGLSDHGDKAIVRFYHVNGDDIEKLAVHRVKVGDEGRTVAVACLREPGESVESCPLCENGTTISARMYLKVLVYEKDKQGYYTKMPKLAIWERGSGFRKQIQSLINRYASGDKALMDTIFEIERDGKKGDQKTQYHIYKVDDLESDECPIPNEEDIEDFNAFGTIVQDRDFDEMNYYIDNNEFPPKENNKQSKERNTERGSRNRNVENDSDDEEVQEEKPTGRRPRLKDSSSDDETTPSSRPRRTSSRF